VLNTTVLLLLVAVAMALMVGIVLAFFFMDTREVQGVMG
jgi:uncharacterized protein involved in exopolysaccharide biosynthesis